MRSLHILRAYSITGHFGFDILDIYLLKWSKIWIKKPTAQPHNLDQHIEELKKSFHHHDNRLLIENIPNLFACLEDDSEIEDCTKVTNFR